MNMEKRGLLSFRGLILRAWNGKYKSKQASRCEPWFAAQGDKTLRLDYDLKANSIVFDLGGHEGQWASDIFSRYTCWIYVFEPVPEFAEAIQRRFLRNNKIKVFPFGLAHQKMTATISVDRDRSSLYRTSPSGSSLVNLRKASEFFNEEGIVGIDLMKINIEGGEYDLLEHLIDSGWVRKIRDIQVQFHDFVPSAESRMRTIQNKLLSTHYLTFQYVFVWENWRSKESI
ncbi:FkbM family methyltransferase [Nitrospiraceae bacterium AH_259_D15_M11_P09]|nr:FkbM family methyltransferase [Nitrospiraceae bacterium AH_259_D15_M11_P09]